MWRDIFLSFICKRTRLETIRPYDLIFLINCGRYNYQLPSSSAGRYGTELVVDNYTKWLVDNEINEALKDNKETK